MSHSSGGQQPKSSSQWGWLPLEGLREILFPAHVPVLVIEGKLWCFLACDWIPPKLASIFTWLLPVSWWVSDLPLFYKDLSHNWRPTWISRIISFQDLYLNYIYRDLYSKYHILSLSGDMNLEGMVFNPPHSQYKLPLNCDLASPGLFPSGVVAASIRPSSNVNFQNSFSFSHQNPLKCYF